MLPREENELLTRVGQDTAMGKTMRLYWIPALLARELQEPDGTPVRVRLLGEDLVAFRDSSGTVGLVSAFCPHRRAPMFFGRNEECGLRCVYHGWKFDVTGTCVDMPSEPPDSLFKTKVTIAAYPTFEAADIVWAYLGPPELKPEPPGHELVRTPPTHRHVSKSFEDCNFLQALEGGIDPTHAPLRSNFQPWYTQCRPQSSLRPKNIGARRCGQNASTMPISPFVSRNATRSSPRIRARTGGASGAPSSDAGMMGVQKRRKSSPIGVLGPVRTSNSLSALVSIVGDLSPGLRENP